mgnify:CR=1 FL=1
MGRNVAGFILVLLLEYDLLIVERKGADFISVKS